MVAKEVFLIQEKLDMEIHRLSVFLQRQATVLSTLRSGDSQYPLMERTPRAQIEQVIQIITGIAAAADLELIAELARDAIYARTEK